MFDALEPGDGYTKLHSTDKPCRRENKILKTLKGKLVSDVLKDPKTTANILVNDSAKSAKLYRWSFIQYFLYSKFHPDR